MSDVRHVLVLPDRDAAEEAARELGERFGVTEEPQLVPVSYTHLTLPTIYSV